MLFWAYLYVLICTVVEKIIKYWGMPFGIKTIVIVFYVIGLLLWIKRQKKNNYIRLKINHNFSPQKMIRLLPVLMLPIFNIAIYGLRFDFFDTVTMLCVATVEEIFFRGFLQHFFEKKSIVGAVYITSIIFAFFHLVNIVVVRDMVSIIMQMLVAFCVGTCFSAVAIKYDSIVPCIFFHFLINVTGNNDIGKTNISIMIMCMVIYCIYGFYLWKSEQ